MMLKNTPSLFAMLVAGTTAFGADPAPMEKKAFMDLQTTYVSFEITQVGSKDFSAPKDSLTDGSYRINKSLKFELPFNMPLPESCPTTTPTTEAMEEGRCMGWSYMPPDDPSLLDQMASGKVDLSKHPMFSPGVYSVDDVTHFRYRDSPTDGFATETRTYKGSGSAYVARGGMLLCDFKKMTCQVSGVTLGGGDGDQVTITTTSDVPGFVIKSEKQDPGLLLPKIPQEIGNKMMEFPLTLSGPSTLTFTGPGTYQNGPGPDVVVKMIVSSKPATKAGAPSK